MRYIRGTLLALGAALAAGPLAAQSAGTVELGAFGTWTRFGNPLSTDVINHAPRDNGFGFGGRLGIFVARRLELEGDVGYTKVDAAVLVGSGKASYMPIHIGPTYNIRLGEHASFLLGARYVHNKYGDLADFSDHGFGGLVGFRFGPVRIDGTGDWMSSDEVGHGNYHNLGVDAGLSLLLGNKHCRKEDDGVTVTPGNATLERGQRATFAATALHCGKPREVAWSATGGEHYAGRGVHRRADAGQLSRDGDRAEERNERDCDGGDQCTSAAASPATASAGDHCDAHRPQTGSGAGEGARVRAVHRDGDHERRQQSPDRQLSAHRHR